MASHPVVTIQGKEGETLPLPAVFLAPIRPDLVNIVHSSMARNRRQPYAVSKTAGEQTSAESWGTGRAVSRIPRVPGGGTHRAGQGAFGNMCRGGRMFAPTKIWRKWHQKRNVNEKRYAVASAVAASGVPALVLARGHAIESVPEIPLILDPSAHGDLTKTKAAVAALESIAAMEDVRRAKDSHHLRSGSGKARNRRFRQRRGPLIVHASEENVSLGLRNLSGVEIARVDSLNLLQLAPGGHLGRFIVWTKAAFEQLDSVFGTTTKPSELKSGYKLPTAVMSNPDLGRIINSPEIQGVLRDVRPRQRPSRARKNPLKDFATMVRLNPHAAAQRRRAILTNAANAKANKDGRVKTKALKRKQRMVAFKKANPAARTLLETMTNDYEPKLPKAVVDRSNE